MKSTKDTALSSKSRPRFHHSVKSYPRDTMPPRAIALDVTTSSLLKQSSMAAACGQGGKSINPDENESTTSPHDTTSMNYDLNNRLLQIILKNKIGQGHVKQEKEVKVELASGMKKFLPDFFATQRHQTLLNEKSISHDKHEKRDRKCAMGLNLARRLNNRKDNCEDEEFKRECEAELAKRLRDDNFGIHAKNGFKANRRLVKQTFPKGLGADINLNEKKTTRKDDEKTPLIRCSRKDVGDDDSASRAHRDLIARTKASMRLDLVSFSNGSLSGSPVSIRRPHVKENTFSGTQNTHNCTVSESVRTQVQHCLNVQKKDDCIDAVRKYANSSSDTAKCNAKGLEAHLLGCPNRPEVLLGREAAILKDDSEKTELAEDEHHSDKLNKTKAVVETSIATGHDYVMTAKARENSMLKPGCVDNWGALRKIVYYHNRFVVLDIAKEKSEITSRVNGTHSSYCNRSNGVGTEDFGRKILNYTLCPYKDYNRRDRDKNGPFAEKETQIPVKSQTAKYSPTSNNKVEYFLTQEKDVKITPPNNLIHSDDVFNDKKMQNMCNIDRNKRFFADATLGQANKRYVDTDHLRHSSGLLGSKGQTSLKYSFIQGDVQQKPKEYHDSGALKFCEHDSDKINEPQVEVNTGNLSLASGSLGTNPGSESGRFHGYNTDTREPIIIVPLQHMCSACKDESHTTLEENIAHLTAISLKIKDKHSDILCARVRLPNTENWLYDSGDVLSDSPKIQDAKCNGSHDNEPNLISSIRERCQEVGGQGGVSSHGCRHRSVNNRESSGPGSHYGDNGQRLINGSQTQMSGHTTIQRDLLCECAKSSAFTGLELYNDCPPCVLTRENKIHSHGMVSNFNPSFEPDLALGSQNKTSSLSRQNSIVRESKHCPCDDPTSGKHRQYDKVTLPRTTNRKQAIREAKEGPVQTSSARDCTGQNVNTNSGADAECMINQDPPPRAQVTRRDEQTCAATHAAISIETFSPRRGLDKTPANNQQYFSTPLPRDAPQQVACVVSPPLIVIPPSAPKGSQNDDSQITKESPNRLFHVDDNPLNNCSESARSCDLRSQSSLMLEGRSHVTPRHKLTSTYQTQFSGDVRHRVIPSIVVSVYESTSDRESPRSRPAASSRRKRDVRATSEKDLGLQETARNNLDQERGATCRGEIDARSAGRRETNGGFTAHELVTRDPNLVCPYENGLAGNACSGVNVRIARYESDETTDTRGIEKTGCDLRRSVAQTPALAVVVRHCPDKGRGKNSAPREFLCGSEKANKYGQSGKVLLPRDLRAVDNVTVEQSIQDITDVTQTRERASSLDLSSTSSLKNSPEIGINIRSIIKKKRTSGFPDCDNSEDALAKRAARLAHSPLRCVKVHSTKDAPCFVVDGHLVTHKPPDRVSFAIEDEEIDEELDRRFYNQSNSSTSSKPATRSATTLPLDKQRLPFSRPDHYYPTKSTPLLAESDSDMDGRGIEIIVSDENDARVSTVNSGKRAVLRRIWMILLDNRVAGRPDSERALRPHQEEYRVLKRVLNIIFITIGVALLVSVFVVIIYTQVVDEDSSRADDSPVSTKSNVLPVTQVEPSTSSLTTNSTITPYKTGR